ncbi:hypothetical protein BC940DRAFT_366548 [Gongronella butleri]|nr:hypothetical protein BC940DRAFT_366548 [Gongronella butleri]
MPVDPRDLNTPDAFIEREASMIRLTGKHPFNAEPPLPELEKAGWLTPNELHFVRNHGPVPELNAPEHTLTITGLVNQPITLTLDDILALPRHTIAVSMACAGNRRKEQNMVKQSIGFGWGPSGVSTALWTGVFLRDVLNMRCGGVQPECNFVCFEGCDKTQKGAYGTSLPLYRCMSDHFDVMLAFQMNGDWLPPDHGYPLRLIVPGCIGGRSVKWLTKIDCSDKESTNVFHDNDNKVFPTEVQSAEQATEELWWPRPEYTLYDLNINSVITTPAQGTQLDYNELLQSGKTTYMIKGYAYTGGNRPLTRVEVSLDNGTEWRLADIKTRQNEAMDALKPTLDALETPLDNDKPRFWTWTLWQLEVPVTDLIRSADLVVRAWDVSQNTQPEKLTWNLMGMMNNCWYRVKLEWLADRALAVQCAHPTIAGPVNGGWMDRHLDAAKEDIAHVAKETKNDPSLPTFTMDQVATHSTDDDCWIIVHDKVYDCTNFLQDHPGGPSSIVICAGTDTTEEFDAIHSSKAQAMLDDYLIGYVAASDTASVSTPAMTSSATSVDEEEHANGKLLSTAPSSVSLATTVFGENDVFLNPRAWLDLTLEKKTRLSPAIHLYRFNYGTKAPLGLPVGQHMYLKLYDEELQKPVMRAYTPSDAGLGWVEFVIKVYYPQGVTPGGLFTPLLDRVRIGEQVKCKGPLGEYEYLGNGSYTIMKQPRPRADHLAMIAGGTGITPMYQILQEIIASDEEPPLISLVYCARFKDDLVLSAELDAMQKKLGKDRFHIRYILSRPPQDWDQGKGRLSHQDIHDHVFKFGINLHTSVLLCGSDTMINDCCKPMLAQERDNAFVKDQVFVF